VKKLYDPTLENESLEMLVNFIRASSFYIL